MDTNDLNGELLQRCETAHCGGGPKAVERQHAQGKRTARERIDRLLDPGSFQEVAPYITHRHTAFDLHHKRFPGDSAVVGFGRIKGRKVAVAAQDFTVIGGSFSEIQAQKVCKVLDMAIASGVPFVALNDSVGARIQEGVWSLTCTGQLYMCLGQDDDADLRAVMRGGADDAALQDAIREAITRKPKGHDFDYSRQRVEGQVGRHMSVTGG